METGKLIFFSGKMGAGKSTHAKRLAHKNNAVLLSEDEWLSALYPNQITSLEDYIKYSKQLKPQIKRLVQSILSTGTNVVMDFPANTIAQRHWFKQIFTEVNAPHQLVFIDVPDEVCVKQIEKRRKEQPERAATDTVEMFEQVSKYFVAPMDDEGFEINKVSGTL